MDQQTDKPPSPAPTKPPLIRRRPAAKKSEWLPRLTYALIVLALCIALLGSAAQRDLTFWIVVVTPLLIAAAINWKNLRGYLQRTSKAPSARAPLALDAVAPIAAPPVQVVVSPTQEDEGVLAEVAKLRAKRTGWVTKLLVLAGSLAVFFILGLLRNPLLGLGVIVGVILFHELGHYIGMRIFGFRDVRMFFIPLFGAAVSGRQDGVPAYKRAMVTLLGPIPGLLVAAVLAVICTRTHSEWLLYLAVMFFAINAFNLLPFFPLDGGRLLHEVLLQRNRHAEAAFRVLSGAALLAYGIFVSAWLLAGLGVFMIILASVAFKDAGVAEQARRTMPSAPAGPVEQMSLEQTAHLVPLIKTAWPALRKPKQIAVRLDAIWDRLTGSVPGWPATLGFLAFYGASIFLCVAAPVGLVAASAEVRTIPAADGARARQVTWLFGRPVTEIELSADGLYDGRQVDRMPFNDALIDECGWLAGRPHGEYKTYNYQGRVERIIVYDRGRFVVCREPLGNSWVEKKLADMPRSFQEQLARDLAAPPKGAKGK